MEIVEDHGFCFVLYENYLCHNLNGPSVIFTKGDYAGILQYYIYGKWLGNNLSNKEFERLKSIELKKRIFE